MVLYCGNSKFLDFSFLKISTKRMAPLIRPWYETVTLHGANKQHSCWTELPKTVSCAFWCVQKSWRVDGQPAHFPLPSHPRVPKKAIPSHLADVLLQPLDPVHPQHEPELQGAEPPAQGDLPVLQPREKSSCQRSPMLWLSRTYTLPRFWSEPHCHILRALARDASNNKRNIYSWFINPCFFKLKLAKGVGARMEGSRGKSNFLCASWILLKGFRKTSIWETHAHWLV